MADDTLVLSPPARWRFTDADDIAAYGDRWWPYEERKLARLKGRELIALEEAVDMPLLLMFHGMRAEQTLAKMAAMWISMHREGHPVAWDDFNPLVLAVDWERVPQPPLDSGEAPVTGSSSSPAPATESATS